MPRLVSPTALHALRASSTITAGPAAASRGVAAFSCFLSTAAGASALPRNSVSKVSASRSTKLALARRFAPFALSANASFFSTSAVTMAGGLGAGEDNVRPPPDQVLQDIADYVHNYDINSDVAYKTARLCLLDTLGCGIEALRYPQAKAITGPVVPGTVVPNGARVIGTDHVLDPIRAAFNNGALVRWLDFNDT
ncbi:hypothetical protein K437DRAFT_271370 [Tilletiaria anomala UBC 951]|uniref:MmgE/PrpD N-terminal domain-containing protein n=1 Tax=Tilletiaria anomala (strain ATCC 24038 / CBS 436.72 / UBC 951) TaxID=1037660 RepID=A0A066V4B0_TILAU|nr:uncharacterized protein K437DRAFT_271370 [Tilletiaria anomala UBC 951]KDN35078.1 hypothetical protein K437DRAFT_271370 [Tilletiaria anomala UBC 951]